MGKQKDFRRIRHPLHMKKDKQFDKTAKTLRTSCQENYLKSVEVAVQQELESTANAKKIGRHVRKELDRYPLLAKAAFLGCERVIDSILEAGENINVQIPDGRTPLILAVENGYPEIVEKLLKKGADPKLIRPDGKNALMTAVAKNDNQTLMSIWTYWDKSCFWELNHTDTKGYTVLSLAVKGGHSHFTSILLNLNGLELDKQTIEGKTALMFAVTGGHINVVQSLLSCGSDFALEDTNGATAICLAISQNQHEIKELLYESLDSKSRDMYVKKRIELLTRPRPAEIAAIITFYKDILFRVILEIRKSFEDGVVLLEKHRTIAGLYKCLDTHQQNTDLLRIGFHLTALLIYDKAEYSLYIAEELAEQYVNTKFADFTLKIMQRHRLKGMTELRGAAFLCIHAGTQCRSGKTWLKSNYFQILPFVKEFKVILSTLTFWGDGESAKAKIMYDRFLEIFELVEKDIKISCIMPPETSSNFAEQNPPPESADKDIIVISSKLSNTSVTNIDRQVVSKTSNNKGSKTVSNTVVHSIANKKDYKKKNKPIKFKTKVHSKFSAKMLAQRPNLKFTPNLEKKIPTMPSEGKVTQVCYADVLKKNLRNEEISNQGHEAGNFGIYQDDHDFLSDKQTWARLKAYSLSDIELDYEIDRKKLNSTKKPAEKEINVNLKGNDFSNLKINEKQTEGNFYDCWRKSSTSEYPTDLMTFITNLFRENELKNQVLSKNAQCENPELDDTVTVHSDGKQSKALRDILIALGLKTDLDKDDTDESRYTTQNKTEVTTKNKCKVTVNEANANAASGEFLYSDCLKSTPGNELSNKKSLESTIMETDVSVTKNAKHLVIHKDATIVKTFKHENIESYLINDCKKATEKDRNMIQLEVDEGVRHCAVNGNEVKFSDNSPLSLELQDNNEISNKENTKIVKDDFNRKFSNSIFISSLKRKNPETYYRDLSFNAYKEEIKEVKVESSFQLSCNFEYCINLCRKSEVKNKMNIFPWAKMNTVLKKTITVSKIREDNNGIESCFNTYRVHASKVGYPELVRSNPTEYIDVISTGDQGICNLNLERYPEKNITMSSKNLVLHEISDDKRIFGELKKIFHMIINGKISNFDQDCQKPKKNPKFIGTHRSLLCGTSVIIPEMTLNIEKFMFLYKRLIIFQVMDRPHLSVLYMNTQCRLPITDLKYQFDSKDSATESKDLKKFDYCHHETSKMRSVKNSITFFEEYKMLKKFKSEINQIMSYLPVHSTKLVRKQHKYLRRVGMGVSTVSNKIKRTKEEVPIYKDTKSIDTSFTLCNNAYGYKPNFINCEQRSRWYEKLQRIESCVPLATFLVGFGVTERAKCNLHEIISATGKIVFSSKEEHVLRQGDFGTHIGIMANGNPVVVRMFKKNGHKTLELLSTRRHLDHKNIVSFYCLCSSSNDQRMFAVSELMEFSLAECIKMKFIHSDKSLLIRDLLNAIQYFQRMQIVHGFLKPSNVMITLDGRLKVSDFYMLGVTPVVYGIVSNQSTKDPAPIGTSAISDFCWRPYELIAATTEMDAQVLTKASDIQMTGMLIYYILSGGKHPFGSTNVQCQENIRDGTPEFGPRPSDIESRDLVRDMIRRTPSKRLTLQEVTKHPYLWNIARRIQFLADVARKIEFFIWKPTKIAESLHDSCIEARDWTCNIHPEILKCVSKWTYKVYANNYSDLLHFILSIHDNFEILPQEVKSYMVHPSFFISATFPTFFMSVYCVLGDNPLVHQQMALQAYF